MSFGRPGKLKQRHIDCIDEYLQETDDEWVEFRKSESTNKNGGSESWEHKLKVNIPSFVGLLVFYSRKDRELEIELGRKLLPEESLNICQDTLNEWKKKGIANAKGDELFNDFSLSLDKIYKKQEIMLLNGGLSNAYNSTIAKMLLNVNHGYKETETVEFNGKMNIDAKELDNSSLEELKSFISDCIK